MLMTKMADKETTAFLQKLMNPALTMRRVLVNIPMRVFSHELTRKAKWTGEAIHSCMATESRESRNKEIHHVWVVLGKEKTPHEYATFEMAELFSGDLPRMIRHPFYG
ncbi:MAG: hypothetical protein A2845_01465 [Candidatus Lloydbacteria bacterium RIFCSPHIGHO2_01_FULL_49_22]|uniref:Uncharacterized protein n=1 Tax=Candidatus Lloydbacteria bacterium RIFCSPHIGHO2_01_FULL_49_22 TaxID=1798658 RepID=A0A1G2CXH1_9BACT|nr:MAG: hypothetical protein A2845_01465 [Candidatus Lloydbacteria bacterium RIFCSPHIGHO2_01_FULL_49_22]OGZ09966.1 MAG: hypothetical protein A3C14_04630 [Candidatus Lloydbacteria bacterium RIFCSPHIGHO2_02_FULL_50_18]